MGWLKGMFGDRRRPAAEADEWVSQDWESATPPPPRLAGFAEAMAAFEAGAAAILGRPLPPPSAPPTPAIQPDPPPPKWSAPRYGFEPEEDRDDEQEAPA